MNKTKTIITSALPYVNNSPHLGNLIGSLLSADVYTRYRRIHKTDNEDIVFVAGVDEYGTATEVKARELNVSCKELCDSNSELHKDVYTWFMISPDCYGRTSQPNGDPSQVQTDWPQTKITHDIFTNLCKEGYVIEQKEQVLFCPSLNTFVADRFVIGTCPSCKSPKANSDQCDQCGKMLSASDVILPKYKPDPKLALEIRDTNNLYIDTNKIWSDKDMIEWFNKVNQGWTKVATTITRDWINMGLKPRSITRDLIWGTKVPNTPEFGDKYSSKVFYVWFDAPIGYISITENILGVERSEYFWKDPSTKLIQFMAKDNVPFHSVIFPVTLRGSTYSNISDIDIVSTEYLMYEGDKFSKTNNVGLFCDDVVKISKILDIPPDYWRAYLISIRPESSDSNFVLNGEGGFVDFVNNVLINNFGNLVHRVISIAFQIHSKHNIEKIILDNITTTTNTGDLSINMEKDCSKIYSEYQKHMIEYGLNGALRNSLTYSSRLNQCVNDFAPWVLIKDDTKKERLYEFMNLMYIHIKILLNMFEPFMPSICNRIRKDIIYEIVNVTTIITLPTTKPVVVIKPLEKIKIDERDK
jgi:methionyl-tRNA synthetase